MWLITVAVLISSLATIATAVIVVVVRGPGAALLQGVHEFGDCGRHAFIDAVVVALE